jgi:hypothetical protein
MKCPFCKEDIAAVILESKAVQDIRLEGKMLGGEIINSVFTVKNIACPECGADLTKKVKWKPEEYGFLDNEDPQE